MAKRWTQERFIERANEIHENKYDYSRTVFCGITCKVEIICPEHGVFWQQAKDHIHRKAGCPECGYKYRNMRHTKTTKDFVSMAKKVHGNRYDYSKTVYGKMDFEVIITCPIHGDFEILAKMHIHRKSGCPECSSRTSKGVQEISDILSDLEIPFETEKTFNDLVNPETGYRLRLDFFLPETDIAIEFDGRQHFEPDTSFGDSLEDIQLRDSIKNQWALDNDIQLVRISYEDHKKGLIASILSWLFG